MAELARQTESGIDISAAETVLSYEYTDDDPIQVIIRCDIGDSLKPVTGAGTYVGEVYINDVAVVPDFNATLAADETRAIIISRPVPLDSGDVLRVDITGLVGDTDVNTVTSVRNATPVTLQDLIGPGATLVDHDYGGDDSLRFITSDGSGIANAAIAAYVKSEYDTLGTEATIRGRSHTLVDGRWYNAMALLPGTYTILYTKPGDYRPAVVDITIT